MSVPQNPPPMIAIVFMGDFANFDSVHGRNTSVPLWPWVGSIFRSSAACRREIARHTRDRPAQGQGLFSHANIANVWSNVRRFYM